MKGKLFVLLVGMALLVGMLSGCVEEPEPTPPVNSPPTAGFIYDPMVNITTDTNITFTDTSTDTDGNISFWTWTFGDGATSTEQNPEHTYDEDNTTYTVTLTVDDDDGATNMTTKDVTVGTPPVPPTAGFIYDPMVNITTDTNITFTDNSTAGNSAIENWTWDFGDGNYSYDQNATHKYAVNDTYTVTLTITDANDETDVATEDIIVGTEEA